MNTVPTPLQEIDLSIKDNPNNIRLFLKQEYLNHPLIQGNKWRKLKYNLEAFRESGKKNLLTFGGAFSNHIHATAAMGKHFGISTIGIIRGERAAILSPTLNFAEANGMQLHFISREKYRNKYQENQLEEWKTLFDNFYLLPEGGTNEAALRGCRELGEEIMQQTTTLTPDIVCLPVGTGGTLAGLVSGLPPSIQVIGFSVLKGEFIKREVRSLVEQFGGHDTCSYKVNVSYHFGGYAKWSTELVDFMNSFKNKHDIPIDPVYNGKMMYGILDLIRKGYFPEGTKILAIHTGGLQGIEGFNQRFGNLLH